MAPTSSVDSVQRVDAMIGVIKDGDDFLVCIYCDNNHKGQVPFRNARNYVEETKMQRCWWEGVGSHSRFNTAVDDIRNYFSGIHFTPRYWICAHLVGAFIDDVKACGVGFGPNAKCIERAANLALVLSRALWFFRTDPDARALQDGILESFYPNDLGDWVDRCRALADQLRLTSAHPGQVSCNDDDEEYC